MLREGLARVLAEYPAARTGQLTDHPLAAFITHDLADAVADAVASGSYKVTGSPGRGNWAETPWVSVFDRLVTETAQRGFFLVYLFRGDGAAVFLSLNQGTTEALDLFGSEYLSELTARARSYARLLMARDSSGLVEGPIDLGGSGRLSLGYQAGSVFAIEYALPVPKEERLLGDLQRMLALYRVLVESRDQLVEDGDPAALASAIDAGMEAQKERWHKRSERNPRLARDAKRVHGTTCAVCGFNFEERYGELGAGYIEAHHLTPFSELLGRPTQLDPRTDFTVVCPNCHRMLHRQSPPLTPKTLAALLR